jgi:general stress protein 26
MGDVKPGGHNDYENAPTEKKLEEMYDLIEGMEVAMFTTRRPDGHLVSRALATQERNDDVADLIYVVDIDSNKIDELEFDPHVNASYYRDRTREWVSVSGVARVSQDRALIRELYRPDWRAWFGDAGGERDGGPDDPRLALVLVDAQSVVYLKNDTPRPVVLWRVVKGMVTGQKPDIGTMRRVDGDELDGSVQRAGR